MATKQENEDIKTLQSDVGDLKTDVAVMKNDLGYVKDAAKDMKDFIEANKRGITTASLLDNKVVSLVIGGIVTAGIIVAAKGGL